MKVMATYPDGSALVEFENITRRTDVVGLTAPIQAMVPISQITDLVKSVQKGRRAAQSLSSLFRKD